MEAVLAAITFTDLLAVLMQILGGGIALTLIFWAFGHGKRAVDKV